MQLRLIILSTLFFFIVTSVYSQQITYKTNLLGTRYYLDHKKIPKSELNILMEYYPSTSITWQNSKKYNYWGLGASVASIGCAIWHLNKYNAASGLSTVPNLLAAGMAATAAYFFSAAGIQKRKAIRKFNSLNDLGVNFNLGTTKEGIGLVISF